MTCGPYNGGMLRERVAFQRENYTPDAAGGGSKTWVAVSGAPVWAAVRGQGSREVARANRTDAVTSLVVVTRYTAAVREADSVVIRGRRHNIIGIDNWEWADQWSLFRVDGGVPC